MQSALRPRRVRSTGSALSKFASLARPAKFDLLSLAVEPVSHAARHQAAVHYRLVVMSVDFQANC